MKVCVTCFDFQPNNFRRQPWRFIFEVTKGLVESGMEVVVITDVKSEEIDGIRIVKVNKLKSIFGESKELIEVINREDPDILVMNIGLTSFLRFNIKTKKPIIGIFTSPIHSIGEVLNVGIYELIKNHNHTLIHVIGALIPPYFIKKNSKFFDHIIVLSKANETRLKKKGVLTKISTIYPGIDETFLIPPNEENVKLIKKTINPENLPLIMYYTSPLTLRGTDTLVKSFSKVQKVVKSKLIILSRREHRYLSKEEVILEKIASKEGITNSMEIIPKYLNPEEIKEYLCSADVICLPFKLIMSEIPISILESMALGKVVVSTDIGCIPELLDEDALTKANNPEELSNVIIKILRDEGLSRKIKLNSKLFMKSFPSWVQVRISFLKIICGLNYE